MIPGSEDSLFIRVEAFALGRVNASAHPSHAHPGPTWQMSWREMQVLPQAFPLWQILQQVCAVAVERTEVEGVAQREVWARLGVMAWSAMAAEGGDSARAGVVSERKRIRTRRVRGMGFVRDTCVIRRMLEDPPPVMSATPGRRSQIWRRWGRIDALSGAL